MGWPEVAGNGRKSQEQSVTTVAAAAASPARSRRVRRRLAVKSYRWDRLDVPLLPVQRVLQVAGRWGLLWSKPPRLVNGSKIA